MNVKQKILVKHLSKYFLVRIKIPTLVEIPSWPGRRELRIDEVCTSHVMRLNSTIPGPRKSAFVYLTNELHVGLDGVTVVKQGFERLQKNSCAASAIFNTLITNSVHGVGLNTILPGPH